MQQTLLYTLRRLTGSHSLPQGLREDCFALHPPEVFGESCQPLSEPGHEFLRCWVAAGSIYETYRKVEKNLHLCLEQHPKLAKKRPAKGFTSCLIGLEAQHEAVEEPYEAPVGPVAILHCEHADYREKAVKLIKLQPFWQTFVSLSPQFQIIHRDKAPMLIAMSHRRATRRTCTIFTSPKGNSRAPMICFDENDGPVIATIGGVFEINGRHYALSVGHVLQPIPKEVPGIPPTVDPDNDDLPQFVDDDSISPVSSDNEDNESEDFIQNRLDVRQIPPDFISITTQSSVFRTSVDFPDCVCDWSLLEVDADTLVTLPVRPLVYNSDYGGISPIPYATAEQIYRNVQSESIMVSVRTSSSNLVLGILIHYPRSFSAEGTKGYIQLSAVRTLESLCFGDCGSWVYDAGSRWLGHIVAIEPGTNIAFFIDASSTAREIRRQLNLHKSFEARLLPNPISTSRKKYDWSDHIDPDTLQDSDGQNDSENRQPYHPDNPTETVPLTERSEPLRRSHTRRLGACEPCQANKTKCDGRAPCYPCRKRGRPECPCIYSPASILIQQATEEMRRNAEEVGLNPDPDPNPLPEVYEEDSKPEHTSALDTANNIGVFRSGENTLTEAKRKYERKMAFWEVHFGHDHTSTLRAKNDLGVVYLAQRKLEIAEQMFRQAITGYWDKFRSENLLVLNTVNNLAILYTIQSRLEEAEDMYNRVLNGYEDALGPDHISTIHTLNNLGILYYAQGKRGKAEEMYEKALAGYEKLLGLEHNPNLPDRPSTPSRTQTTKLGYMDHVEPSSQQTRESDVLQHAQRKIEEHTARPQPRFSNNLFF